MKKFTLLSGWIVAGALVVLSLFTSRPIISGDNVRPVAKAQGRPAPLPVVVAGSRMDDAAHARTVIIPAPTPAPAASAPAAQPKPSNLPVKPPARPKLSKTVCVPGEYSPECENDKHHDQAPRQILLAREFGLTRTCNPWYSISGNYYCD